MRSKLLVSVVFALACASVLVFVYARYRPLPSEVLFLAVGQGDSTLLKVKGINILVDAGPESAGAGRSLLLTKLRERSVHKLDFLLLTHPDGDHIGGAQAVLRQYPEATVVANRAFASHPEMVALLENAKVPANRVLWTDGLIRWTVGSAWMQVWSPEVAEGDNEGSLIVRMVDGASEVTLSGDSPAEVEAMAAEQGDWKADVMSAGHHGSRTAQSERWLNEVQPEAVVASCGRDNRYGHPHQETIDAVARAGARFYRTDRDGDIRFVASASGFVLGH